MDEAYLKVTSVDQTLHEFLDVFGISENCYKVSNHNKSSFKLQLDELSK
jgi:hypothetical protein